MRPTVSRPYRVQTATIPGPTLGRAVRGDDPAPFTYRHARPVAESEPQSAANLIAEHGAGRNARPQARPRNPLDDSLIDDVRQRRVLADPDVARGISGECLHTRGKPVDRAEAAVLEHDDAAVCRHPDPLPVVLEERLDQVVRQPCVGHHAPGWSGEILRERSSLLRHDPPVPQAVQSAQRAHQTLPSLAGSTDQGVPSDNPVVRRNRRDRGVAEAVEPVVGGNPDVAFTIFDEALT